MDETDFGAPLSYLLTLLTFLSLSPIGLTFGVMAALGALLAGVLRLARKASRLPGHESFDVGGPFDQFYRGVLPPLKSGVTEFICAGYAAFLLLRVVNNEDYAWLDEAHHRVILGYTSALIVLVPVGYAVAKVSKATWFAARWIRLEARGIRWHIADSGEAYRIIWLRPTGEYLFDTTIRDHRLQQEVAARRTRRVDRTTTALKAFASIVVWLVLPVVIALFYPLLSPDVAAVFDTWVVPAVSWLIFLFAVIPNVVAFLGSVAEELVYRAGAQFIPGATVQGARPARVGRQDVEAQKAHGDADFVDATEAVRRMKERSEL